MSQIIINLYPVSLCRFRVVLIQGGYERFKSIPLDCDTNTANLIADRLRLERSITGDFDAVVSQAEMILSNGITWSH